MGQSKKLEPWAQSHMQKDSTHPCAEFMSKSGRLFKFKFRAAPLKERNRIYTRLSQKLPPEKWMMQKIKHNGEAHNNNLTTHGVYCSNGKRYLLYKRKDADITWK